MIAASRSAESSMAAEQPAWSSAVHRTSGVRSVETAALIPASGVRRSWETAASSAVRIRLPCSSRSASAACAASSARSSTTARWVANAASTRRSCGGSGRPRSSSTTRLGRRRRPASASAGVERRVGRPGRPPRSRSAGPSRSSVAAVMSKVSQHQVQQLVDAVPGAQQRPVQPAQRVGLAAGQVGLHRPPGGGVDHRGDRRPRPPGTAPARPRCRRRRRVSVCSGGVKK